MSKIYVSLGLMSGTSLDGVDAAIITTDGTRLLEQGPSFTRPYSDTEREILSQATQEALQWDFNGPPPNSFAQAEDCLDKAHAEAIAQLFNDDIDVIGYHGQTLIHRPDRRRTLQIGRGAGLANRFNIPVVYDFRSTDVKAGGQGAPLAPIYHKALVDAARLPGVTIVLNLGGVGNVTLIHDGDLMASDTGPANGPLDSFLDARGARMDRGGAISEGGVPDFALIETWLRAAFFQKPWPKAADRYDFDVLSDMSGKSVADGAATLCAFTAMSVKHTLAQMEGRPDRVIVCGGGRHNRTIMTLLAIELGCPVVPAEQYGWDSDAIEAQAFAYLAVRVLRDLPNSFPLTTGVSHPVVGGQIARPGKF